MRFYLLSIVTFLTLPSLAFAEPALPRINASQTIKCGYVEYEPALMQDMNTKTFKGFDADMVAAIANRLELKLDYVAATGWATVAADLNASKFDMLCTGFWVHPNVAKFALFSRPFFYQPVFVVARADDPRFQNGVPELDTAELKMVALDGDNPVHIAHNEFPKAQVLALPNMTDFSQVLINVADKKADFTIVDAVTFGNYNASNPDKLKIVDPKSPIRTYPVAYAFRSEDVQFRDAVNTAIEELILDGTVDKIFDKVDKYPHSYYRPVIPHKHNYKD